MKSHMRSPELSDMRVGQFSAALDIIPQTANHRHHRRHRHDWRAPVIENGVEVRSKATEDMAIHHAVAPVTQSGTVWVTGPEAEPGWVHTETAGGVRI